MNKAIAAIGGIATIGAAAGVPTALMAGNSVNEDDDREEPTNKKPEWSGLMPTLNSSQDIQTNYQNIECVKDKLQGIQNWDKSSSSESDEDLNFDPSQTNGCLIVDYYKQKYEENKWQGKFKLVWSTVGSGSGDRGFITVVHAEAKNGKLTVDSSFYSLSKQSGNWSVKNRTNGNKEITDESDLPKWMPQPGNAIEGYENKGEQYWGFNLKLSDICKKEACGKENGNRTEFSSIWTISYNSSENENKSIFANLNEWFKNGLNDNEENFFGPISSSLTSPELTRKNKNP